MPKVLILKGLPASGKSTWAKDFCKQNKDWVRVCRDDLRTMRGEYWIPKQEDFITDLERGFIDSALNRGLNVIVDATNLNSKFRNTLIEFIGDRAKVEFKFFECGVEECIKRDRLRENSVGEKIIWDMYEKYVKKTEVANPVIQNGSLPKAIIVDIDGTLAKMSDRSPYDWSRVGEDSLNNPVAEIIKKFRETHKIIILTGRDGSCEEITKNWLKNNGVVFDCFYIRPEGNIEKDAVIKKRIFNEHIRGNFFIEFVLDDRLQVCRMWHSIGLTLLRVGDPDSDF